MIKKELNKCNLCPRKCLVNRNQGELGFCMANNKLTIARNALHYWEEPSISGTKGSGTIFFSNCNLQCIYCQNYQISLNHIGHNITINEFSKICLNLQQQGAHNINLVTPTHYIPLIKEGIINAKKKGLTIPIVYNTSSYENVESLKLLEGLIDIYLPDLKYYDEKWAINYSKAPNYFTIASSAIKEMYRQVGKNVFDQNGLMKKGVIVRHLMLPDNLEDSKQIIKYLYDTYQDNIYISIMNQYTPLKNVKNHPVLNKKIKQSEYDILINYACDLNIKHAYIQEGNTQEESYIPEFK